MDAKSFANGFLCGLMGKGVLRGNKEPVAYLYNGVRLPKLPEWDRESYPYAYLSSHNSTSSGGNGDYLLFCTSEPVRITKTTNANTGEQFDVATCDGDGILYWYGDSGEWVKDSYTASEHTANATYWALFWGGIWAMIRSADLAVTCFWSNTDVLNEDESVYIAASEPRALYVGDVLKNLFDGEVTTAASEGSEVCQSGEVEVDGYVTGKLRIRLAGNALNVDITRSFNSVAFWAGNKHFIDSESEDTGETWCLRSVGYGKVFVLYTTIPGTYSVKIERLVTE